VDPKIAVASATAPTKETFTLVSEDDVSGLADQLLAETVVDDEGDFSIELGEGYDGGPFRVDVRLDTVPGRPDSAEKHATQFSITTLQPRWRQTENGFYSAWPYCIPDRFWCSIRARYGAWVICGRLETCEGGAPVPGATVTAFDADWLQDDEIGSAVTDSAGHFRIDYSTADFRITPLSPLINFELIGGPDLYFTAELGGNPIYAEDRSVGRTPARENSPQCVCVTLCTDEIVGDPEQNPHWQRVEGFDIYPKAPNPASQFTSEGFAGSDLVVFGEEVRLHGNCPLRNVAAPSNPLEYRFVVGEWTWSGGVEDPAVPPPNAPATLDPVVAIHNTTVGYVFYTDAFSMPASAPVIINSSSTGADGWIRIDGMSVTVPMNDGTTSVVTVSPTNFLRTFDLIDMNSNAITSLHPAKLGSLGGGVPSTEAGRSLLAAEQEPIRRYHLRFEVRDGVTLAPVHSDDLESIVLDNSPVIWGLHLEELLADLCNPLAGATDVHILYTIDHPHLRWFNIEISNNTGTVHPAPPLPNGAFGGSFLFRGGAGGPSNGTGTGGFAVNVSGDPPCAYSVRLSWHTRRLYASSTSRQVLYCT